MAMPLSLENMAVRFGSTTPKSPRNRPPASDSQVDDSAWGHARATISSRQQQSRARPMSRDATFSVLASGSMRLPYGTFWPLHCSRDVPSQQRKVQIPDQAKFRAKTRHNSVMD